MSRTTYPEAVAMIIGGTMFAVGFFIFAGITIDHAHKNNVGEYYCNHHDGLASINPHNYRDFTCRDGSSWHVSVENVSPKYSDGVNSR